MIVKDSINIAVDFHKSLGARYRYEGPHSGEEFLEKILLPKFLEAERGNHKIEVVLDGVIGYPSSFVSGSFGKLALDKGAKNVLKHLVFRSTNPIRLQKILYEIENPIKKYA